MKFLGSILLVLIVLLSVAGDLITIAEFQLNREKITSKYCQNLDKPERSCKGKCYLTKTLKNQQEHEESANLRYYNINLIYIFNQVLIFTARYTEAELSTPAFSKTFFEKDIYRDIFRPPRV